MNLCATCSRPAEFGCEKCKTPYCSVECQTKSWQGGHHSICWRPEFEHKAVFIISSSISPVNLKLIFEPLQRDIPSVMFHFEYPLDSDTHSPVIAVELVGQTPKEGSMLNTFKNNAVYQKKYNNRANMYFVGLYPGTEELVPKTLLLRNFFHSQDTIRVLFYYNRPYALLTSNSRYWKFISELKAWLNE